MTSTWNSWTIAHASEIGFDGERWAVVTTDDLRPVQWFGTRKEALDYLDYLAYLRRY